MQLHKFGNIEQFRHVIKQVKEYSHKHNTPIPTLTFNGTVKLHGTNAGVGYDPQTKEIWCQSRERIITPDSDNAGFANFIETIKPELTRWFDQLYLRYGDTCDILMIYGEWAGGNIQKGVALNQLEKAWYIFQVKVLLHNSNSDYFFQSFDNWDIMSYTVPLISKVYDINDFTTWTVDIDFNYPEQIQNYLVEQTLKVEEQCPVAAKFGVNGIGEGVVWKNDEYNLIFKTKGEKHSVTKVKTLAAVDTEKLNTLTEFVDVVLTENRLNQGLDKLTELGLDLDIKNIGTYLKWIANDVLKEEMDTMIASNINAKELMPKINIKAKKYFMSKL